MSNIKYTPAQQLQQILIRYRSLSRSSSSDLRYKDRQEQVEVITSMVAAIERLAPSGTYYYTSLENTIKTHGVNKYAAIPDLAGIIESLRTAYESGYLSEIEELIHADLFSDFIDMSDYLLKEGYKDPAAVIVGGVLEEHLRKLCLKHSITVTIDDRPKKSDTMNADLAREGCYNKLDQKSVTAWLDLRNKAAHGNFTEDTDEQVEIALTGIRDFISRYPA